MLSIAINIKCINYNMYFSHSKILIETGYFCAFMAKKLWPKMLNLKLYFSHTQPTWELHL